MVNGLYAVMATVGVVVLFFIQRITVELKMRGEDGKTFSKVACITTIFCLCDALWGFFGARALPQEKILFIIMSVLFHLMASFVAYVWAVFTFSYLKIQISKVLRILMSVPFLALVVFIFVSIPTNGVFIIDDNMVYSSGPYRYVLFIVQNAYLIFTLIFALVFLSKEEQKDIVWKNRVQGVSLYLIFPVICSVLQEIYPAMPYYSVGFMLSGIIAFLGVTVREEEIHLRERSEQFETKSKDIYSALEALSKSFVSIHLFDLEHKRQNTVKSTPFIDAFVKPEDDGKTQIQKVMAGVSNDKYKQIMVDFVDLDTLPRRMKGRRIISQEFQGLNEGWCVSSFITVEADENDIPVKIIHVVQNIDETKRRESEYSDALKAALESQNAIYAKMLQAQKNGVIALGENDVVVRMNDAAARNLGYASAKDVPSGARLELLMRKVGAEIEDEERFFENCKKHGESGESFSYVFSVGKGEDKKYYQAVVDNFEMTDGNLMYIVSQSDITESRR